MTALRVAVLCVATMTCACGEDRLIGVTCGPDDCTEPDATLPPLTTCVQHTLPAEPVAPGDRLERCVLFTLEGLIEPAGMPRSFLTQVEIDSTPSPHDLDLRIAAELPSDLDPSDQDCAKLLTRAIPWAPVMVTDRMHDEVVFRFAPLVASRAHHLLVIDSFTNLTASPVDAGATVTLSCADSVPTIVSHAFEMTKRGKVTVPPGTMATVTANCTFQKDVRVSRLYRRTRLIRSFEVSRLHGDVVWEKENLDFSRDFDPALEFETGQGFEWTCVYVNDTLSNLEVGGFSPDACALFGIYRLPDGAVDPSPEHCVL